MVTHIGPRSLASALVVIFLWASTALAAPAPQAPATADIGTQIEIQISGSSNPRYFVTIVTKGAAEGRYDDYEYAERSSLKHSVPAAPASTRFVPHRHRD